jgi:hypothetical protein
MLKLGFLLSNSTMTVIVRLYYYQIYFDLIENPLFITPLNVTGKSPSISTIDQKSFYADLNRQFYEKPLQLCTINVQE